MTLLVCYNTYTYSMDIMSTFLYSVCILSMALTKLGGYGGERANTTPPFPTYVLH